MESVWFPYGCAYGLAVLDEGAGEPPAGWSRIVGNLSGQAVQRAERLMSGSVIMGGAGLSIASGHAGK
ncbi:hypothetical protein [Puniceibacterium sediminis]|uniref:hypothetical protein n=1 Tax=Puniceibacterium sediminis TaxID=1608407 RepID=UPI000B77352D|nr:hypothetical protein [Puniceibacterium sediminis]